MGCDSVFVGEGQHGPVFDWVQDRVVLEAGAMVFVFPHVSQVLLHGSKERLYWPLWKPLMGLIILKRPT